MSALVPGNSSRESSRNGLALLIVAGLVGIAWIAFDPFYQTNDDVALRLLLEGRLEPGSGPQNHLMFMSALPGSALSTAYRWFPNVPFYDLLLLAGTVAGSWALLQVLTRAAGFGVYSFFALVLFSTEFLLPFSVAVQFTMVAMLLVGSGILLALDSLLPIAARGVSRRGPVAGAILLLCGFLIRFEAAGLAALTSLLLFPISVTGSFRHLRTGLFKFSLVLCFVIVLAAVAEYFNLFLYAATPGWHDFYQYNAARALLTEWRPAGAENWPSSTMLHAAGWSANDFVMLANWFYPNQAVFGFDHVMAAVQAAYGGSETVTDLLWQRTFDGFRRPITVYLAPLREHWLEFAAVVLFTSFGCRLRQAWRAIYVAAVLLAVIVMIEALLKEAPYRITWPLFVIAAALGWRGVGTSSWGRWAHVLWLVLVLVVAANSLGALVGQSRDRAVAATNLARGLDALPLASSNFFVVWGSALDYGSYVRPFRRETHTENFHIVGLGVINPTPVLQDFLARQQIRDLGLTLCTDTRYVLIAQPPWLPWLQVYLLEHYGVEAQFLPVGENASIPAFRCHAAS